MSKFTDLNTSTTSNTRREKAPLNTLVDGQLHHIAADFVIREGNYGQYATFHVVGDLVHVFYANKPLTRKLQQISDDGLRDDLPAQPVRFVNVSFEADDGRHVEYVDVVFEEVE